MELHLNMLWLLFVSLVAINSQGSSHATTINLYDLHIEKHELYGVLMTCNNPVLLLLRLHTLEQLPQLSFYMMLGDIWYVQETFKVVLRLLLTFPSQAVFLLWQTWMKIVAACKLNWLYKKIPNGCRICYCICSFLKIQCLTDSLHRVIVLTYKGTLGSCCKVLTSDIYLFLLKGDMLLLPLSNYQAIGYL